MASARLALVATVLALAACATVPPPPPPPAGPVPDLRGTWTGTWGGSPLTLVVTEQTDFGADAGLYVGPWPVLGPRGPGIGGVLTSTVRGDAVSVPVVGRLGSEAGRLVVVLAARGRAGDQHLRLAHVDQDQMQGMGESSYPWGPRGVVTLTRRAGPPRSAPGRARR